MKGRMITGPCDVAHLDLSGGRSHRHLCLSSGDARGHTEASGGVKERFPARHMCDASVDACDLVTVSAKSWPGALTPGSLPSRAQRGPAGVWPDEEEPRWVVFQVRCLELGPSKKGSRPLPLGTESASGPFAPCSLNLERNN